MTRTPRRRTRHRRTTKGLPMGSIESISTGSAVVDGGLGLFTTIFSAVESFIVELLGMTGSTGADAAWFQARSGDGTRPHTAQTALATGGGRSSFVRGTIVVGQGRRATRQVRSSPLAMCVT